MDISEQARICKALRERADTEYDQPWADVLHVLADIIQHAPAPSVNDVECYLDERRKGLPDL